MTASYNICIIKKKRYVARYPLFLPPAARPVEITEARAAGTSTRVITKEERRSLFHYFTLRPPTSLENAPSCEDTLSVHSSSDGEKARKAQGGHPMNVTVPPRDGPLGGGEGSVPTREETRAVESETQRDGRRSGSASGKVFGRPRPNGIDEVESMKAGARGQQHSHTAAVGEIVDGRLACDASPTLL